MLTDSNFGLDESTSDKTDKRVSAMGVRPFTTIYASGFLIPFFALNQRRVHTPTPASFIAVLLISTIGAGMPSMASAAMCRG